MGISLSEIRFAVITVSESRAPGGISNIIPSSPKKTPPSGPTTSPSEITSWSPSIQLSTKVLTKMKNKRITDLIFTLVIKSFHLYLCLEFTRMI